MMRIQIALMAALLALGSCNKTTGGYTVRLNLDDADGQWITLSVRSDREYIVLDSVLVEPGKAAILKGRVDGVRTMYLGMKGQKSGTRMLMENADYQVKGSIEAPEITGSGKAQQELNAYRAASEDIEDRLEATVQRYYDAAAAENRAAADSILREYESATLEKEAMDSAYVAENPSSAVSVLLLRNIFYKYNTKALEKVLSSLDESLRGMDEYQYMDGILQRQKEVAVGSPYKDFGLSTPDGEFLKISDIKQGNVLLIDFWASWCGPCRRANPVLVGLYRKYHSRGLEIIGVSLDRDTTRWIGAIAEDHLSWPQISDLKGWDCEGSRLYGVPAIPHTVLVDREGIIRSNDLQGEELEKQVRSLLH